LFLKSLDIHGFKTFAQKTGLTFKPGVTAIVGPNGCGKSNIVDAIRWVLGEANARSLRGEVMEDVIFSGSEEMKPLGMAEVSLTIVNDDNLLPIEYAEVSIKRRLYRSGESEFFINKNRVRLRDIQELFADTGIGKSAYSVMEQGNIDQILSTKPEDRMRVFEEAAGITRYKMRIRDTYRKLSAAEENLVRLDLVIGEVEKEYRNIEKQAETARLYKELKKEDVDLETLHNFYRVRGLKEQVSANDAKIAENRKKRDALAGESEELNKLLSEDVDRVKVLEKEIFDFRSEIYRKEAEIEMLASKTSHINERVRETEREIEKHKRTIVESEKNRDHIRKRVDGIKTESGRLEGLISSQEEKLRGYTREIELIDTYIDKNTALIRKNSARVEEIGTAVASHRQELRDVIDRLLTEIDSIKARYGGSETKKRKLIQRIHEEIERMGNSLKHHTARLRDFGFSSSDSRTAEVIEEMSGAIDKLRDKLGGLRGDIDTVLDIQEELSRVLFGRESLHSKKEEIENAIALLEEEAGVLERENKKLNEETRKNRVKKNNFEDLMSSLRPDIARNRERGKHMVFEIERLGKELERNEDHLEDVRFEITSLEDRKNSFLQDISKLEAAHGEAEGRKAELNGKTRDQNRLIDDIVNKIRVNEAKLEGLKKKLSGHEETIEGIRIKNAELTSRIETIYEHFRDRYSLSLENFKPGKEAGPEETAERRNTIKNRIQELGQVNLIAIEEFQEIKKRYDFLTAQREDLLKAKDDLKSMVSDTLITSKEVFNECFASVKENFRSIFRRLFDGGTTDLYLTNESNIFDAGVEITACPPGKSPKRKSLLSGGEKSLTAAALLFSIFMVRPSPFCMLDEVDHDLDEENVIRFLKLLKEFTDTTQFIIITHNRRTIEFADIIYGVTSEQAGISKVVSLEMTADAVK